tara:strand:- start:2839 stop:3429 length:591 start_codon:yes stop_codon:yes gene_type:complete
MAFWSENYGDGTGLKDPKRNFRFKVEFQGIQGAQGPMLWYAKTATKPSFAISAAEHKYLNHTFYYPGSVTWNDVTITMVDPSDPDMASTLAAIVQDGGYKPPNDPTDLQSISKASAVASLGAVTISQLDSDGNELETWTLWNAFIIDVKFGDSLAYGDENLTELSVTLKYDWARINVTNNGSINTLSQGKKEFFRT